MDSDDFREKGSRRCLNSRLRLTTVSFTIAKMVEGDDSNCDEIEGDMNDCNEDCDLENTQILHELFQVKREERDAEWIAEFMAVSPTASLRTLGSGIQHGPDGFPYLFLALPESDLEFDAFSVQHSLQFCLKAGCGIALFSNTTEAEAPEWVFTFGSLWSYERYGNFTGDPEDGQSKASEAQVSAPSEQFLPAVARSAIKRFLKETTGIEQPRVAQVTDPNLTPSRVLMFADFHQDRFEKKEHFIGLMTALRWFLPDSRGLMAGLPELVPYAVPL